MSSKSNVRLKLLIDKKNQKVLVAEAGKDFVDFLFTLLSLPVGTVIWLLSKNGMVGALGKLYDSVEILSDTYMQPNVSKVTLLKPKIQIGGGARSTLLSLPSSASSTAKRLYVVLICIAPAGMSPKTREPFVLVADTISSARHHMLLRLQSAEGGYVKGVVTYMIMDHLEVKPMSTISSIDLLNEFNVKEVGGLEEKTVSLGMNEGLQLLEASLRSTTVLTDVFMQKKASRKRR